MKTLWGDIVFHKKILTYRLMEALTWAGARALPGRIRERAVILAWAKATTGPYSGTDVTTLTVDEMLRRAFPPDGSVT